MLFVVGNDGGPRPVNLCGLLFASREAQGRPQGAFRKSSYGITLQAILYLSRRKTHDSWQWGNGIGKVWILTYPLNAKNPLIVSQGILVIFCCGQSSDCNGQSFWYPLLAQRPYTDR